MAKTLQEYEHREHDDRDRILPTDSTINSIYI